MSSPAAPASATPPAVSRSVLGQSMPSLAAPASAQKGLATNPYAKRTQALSAGMDGDDEDSEGHQAAAESPVLPHQEPKDIDDAENQPEQPEQQEPPSHNGLKMPLEYVKDKLDRLKTTKHNFPAQALVNGAIHNDAGLHLTDPEDKETLELSRYDAAQNSHLAHAWLYGEEKKKQPIFGGKTSPTLALGKLGFVPTKILNENNLNSSAGFGGATDGVTLTPTPEIGVAKAANQILDHLHSKWSEAIKRGTNPVDEVAIDNELQQKKRHLAGQLYRHNPAHLTLAHQFAQKIKSEYPNMVKEHQPLFDDIERLIAHSSSRYDPKTSLLQPQGWNEHEASWEEVHGELDAREKASRDLLKKTRELIQTDFAHSPYANQLYSIAWDNWRNAHHARDKVDNIIHFARDAEDRATKHREAVNGEENKNILLPDEDLVGGLVRHAQTLPFVNDATGGKDAEADVMRDYVQKASNKQFQNPQEAKEAHKKSMAFMRQFRNYLKGHTQTPDTHQDIQKWEADQAISPRNWADSHQKNAQSWQIMMDKFAHHLSDYEAYRAKLAQQKQAALSAIQYQNSPSDSSYQDFVAALANAKSAQDTYAQARQESVQNPDNRYPANSDVRNYEEEPIDKIVSQMASKTIPLQKGETLWDNVARTTKRIGIFEALRKASLPLTDDVLDALAAKARSS